MSSDEGTTQVVRVGVRVASWVGGRCAFAPARRGASASPPACSRACSSAPPPRGTGPATRWETTHRQRHTPQCRCLKRKPLARKQRAESIPGRQAGGRAVRARASGRASSSSSLGSDGSGWPRKGSGRPRSAPRQPVTCAHEVGLRAFAKAGALGSSASCPSRIAKCALDATKAAQGAGLTSEAECFFLSVSQPDNADAPPPPAPSSPARAPGSRCRGARPPQQRQPERGERGKAVKGVRLSCVDGMRTERSRILPGARGTVRGGVPWRRDRRRGCPRPQP